MEPIPKPKRIKDPVTYEAARRPYCVYCGLSSSVVRYEVHHIRGRTKSDGHDIPENLINLCAGPGSNCCHERAHNRTANGRPPINAKDLKEMLAADLRRQ